MGQKVGTLSGGWRMKLALSRAMLLRADILLLDEPTNHLDAYNVKWVETYLQGLKNVTCIMVSHDSGLHWVERDLMCKNGWEKMLKNLDEKIALRATQFARPLTKENVQKHIADVGLAAEFSTHMRMRALSGGQKVKVVLASALWPQPHILILDESEMVDRFGNTVDIKKTKTKSKRELKLKKQRRLKRLKETGEDYDSSDDEC